jgi:hypothetical protein
MIFKYLAWASFGCAMIFAVLWEVLLFSGQLAKLAGPTPSATTLLVLCLPLVLAIIFGIVLLIISAFDH